MMQGKITLIPVIAATLLLFLLAGCTGGIPQEQYDSLNAQLGESQAQVAELGNKVKEHEEQYETVAAQFKDSHVQLEASQAEIEASQAQIAKLQSEIGGLKERYELVGATPAATAANIVRYYHETHIYSTYDLFVCSDMSSEIWNILKAQEINAIIVIGSKDTVIGDIIQSDHAWVLAEVAPGEYLALETTGGFVVPKSENALYYRGWSFNSPRELKANNQLVREYNVRVGIYNQIAAEDREVVDEHNQATNQQTADTLKAVHDKLTELIKAQGVEMNKILAEIDSLATELR